MEWSYSSSSGHKWNNNTWLKSFDKMVKGEIVTVHVNRLTGTVGFTVHEKYIEAFQDDEIKTGTLHLVCCTGWQKTVFEIVK